MRIAEFYSLIENVMDSEFSNPFAPIIDRLNRIEILLAQLIEKEKSSTQATKESLKSIDVAVSITGLKKKTIYNLVCKRIIPHSKKGKRLYFDEGELNAWIKSGKRKMVNNE